MFKKKGAAFCLAAALLAVQGCGGGGGSEGDGGGDGGGTGGGNQPPPAPTVSLSTSATAARVGEKVTLTWNSQNTSGCTASGAWTGSRGVSGSEAVDLTTVGNSTYMLTCTGTGGSASDTKSVATAAATQQVMIPGAPAAINFAKGSCVATSGADFDMTCVGTAAQIPAKYEAFTGSTSGRVISTPGGQPAVTLGGNCAAGYDRMQSRLLVDTTVVDHALTFAGSSVTEITYKSGFLNSATQGVITQMSVLFFQDTSNTNRVAYVMYAKVSGEDFTFAGAGTIADDGSFDLATCIRDDSPTAPPEEPPVLSCPSGFGAGSNGLELYGVTSYDITNGGANQTSPRSMGWGVRYNNPALASNAYTGSLRMGLWAVSRSYTGGRISGYVLFNGSPNFTGAGARSTSQLYNFTTASNIVSSGSGRNPPAGNYCLVATLEEFSSSCTESDGYCIVDWLQYDEAENFR